ncbi:MAG TPA: S41 family peptidase [Candidatus Angelobacter sp.]|nr:S41 family peptidase [Candidatus Angelobacter sp.]
MKKYFAAWFVAALVIANANLQAQQPLHSPNGKPPARSEAQSPTLTPEMRRNVIQRLGEHLKARYVFPDVGQRAAVGLLNKLAKGSYDAQLSPDEFADLLTRDLQQLGNDRHLRVGFVPDLPPVPEPGSAPNSQEFEAARNMAARTGFGIRRVQHLPGNVGYIDIRGFLNTEFAAPAISASIALLEGSNAIMIDLRNNGGGEPETVAYFLSHFFPVGDPRHLNDIYTRTDNATRSYWTDSSASPRYSGPLYVLTSHETFSGGEECAYDLRVQKRAILVGETTGGGANPGEVMKLVDGFVAFIPTGQSVNPITKTSWEQVGVAPDMASTAKDAARVAYIAALQRAAEQSHDPEQLADLTDILKSAERNEIDLPGYTPRHP